MTQSQIQYFLVVAQTMSISKAAELLFVSQPAVSKQLSLLEEDLEVPLFQRKSQGLEITDAGRAFERLFSDFQLRFKETLSAVRSSRGELHGNFHLGCMEGWDLATFYPGLHAVLEHKYPDIQLHLSGYNHDQMLYALRDVTATVDSLPLIATSILSKKLAAGSDVILLDVKYGEGAFMKTKADAQVLADTMCAIGAHFQRKVRAVISDMNEPLGHAIGNTLEVLEAIDTLQGRGPDDFRTLCIEEAGILLAMADLAADESEGRQRARAALEDGSAFAMLCQMVEAQGGDVRYVKEPQRFAKAPYIKQLPALKEGMIRALHARSFGELAMELGAGRKCKGDRIDPRVGIVLHHKCGETVAADTCIATIHANRELSEDWTRRFYEAVEIEE